jgi:hypothetical protein
MLVLQGCSTMQLPDYPQASANSHKNSTTKNDLCIGLRAMTDPRDLEQYFGTDLSARNVLPVYVVAENKNASSSFVVSQEHISLQHNATKDTVRQGDYTVTGKSSGGAAAAMMGAGGLLVVPLIAAPVLPVLIVGGAKAMSNASVVKRNLASKGLWTRTVSPGKSVDGFVYFNLPEKNGSVKDYSLVIQVDELGNDAKHEFILPLE